ncbi:MAG: hypothetical protein WCI67_07490 [Chloroflexales bacterium]
MPGRTKRTITDTDLGRALRHYLAGFRDLTIVKLAADVPEPFILVPRDDSRSDPERTADEARASGRSLEMLLDGLFGEIEDLGRDLAIHELFDNGQAGFNLNGLSLGTFAAALHLAPDAPIPRELLSAITAAVLPGTYISEEQEATDLIELEPFFTHSAAVFAEATVEHLVEAGVLEYAEDDMVRLNPRLRPVGNGPLDRMGLALAEEALLSLGPRLFLDKEVPLLQRVRPHLERVTDQVLPFATPNAMVLALLAADYYTTVETDDDRLRHYVSQGCTVLDLVIDQLDRALVRRLANDLYGLAKVAQDAGLRDVAQIAYVRSAELRLRGDDGADDEDDDEDDTLFSLLIGPPGGPPAMDWVVIELAVTSSLERGEQGDARRLVGLLQERAEAAGDRVGMRQAEYLTALIELSSGEVEQARHRLYRIVGWCMDAAACGDDLVPVVDYLLVACIELARLELRSGVEAPAARLLSWAEEVLASQATRGDTSAELLNPNDTRHRLRARLCEAQALLAAHQGDRQTALGLFETALRHISYALGHASDEARHLTRQVDRLQRGDSLALE